MEQFVSEIIKKKQTCIFVSPHLDDAILSAGGLLSSLARKTKIIVINVFTESSDAKPTLSAWKYINAMGYQKASNLYEDRRKEDREAFATLGITPINLGFIEALWRKKTGMIANTLGGILPEFGYAYPVYRLHINSGKIAQADKQTIAEISKQTENIVKKEKNPLIFAPMGIGNHVDHCLVKKVCTDLFKTKIIYWSDFPYNMRANDQGTAPKGYRKEEYTHDNEQKQKLIKQYKTQTIGLFSVADIPSYPEIFFLPNSRN